MKVITMSKEQARRMGTPELEGKNVSCDLPTSAEVKKGRNPRVAKNVYIDNRRIGGCMDIDN